MAITPYGAVFENNTPSPMEVQSYYDQKRQRETILNEQKKAAKAKAEADRMQKYSKAVEPLLTYKNKLGVIDTDKIINEKLSSVMAESEKMIRSGKSDTEVAMYVNDNIRGLDTYQEGYKGLEKNVDDYVSGIGNNSGLDTNQLKELMKRRVMFKDENGKTRPLNPDELTNIDLDQVYKSVLYENPDLLSVKDREKLFEHDGKGSIITEEANVFNPNDKTRGRGTYSAKYDSIFQNVIKGTKGDVQVVTKSAPITLQSGEKAVDPLTGQEAKGLPQSAYMAALSKPGLAVLINQKAMEKADQLKTKRSNKDTEFNVFYSLNKGKMAGMSDAEKFNLYRQMSPGKEPEVTEQEMEVLRQAAAYEVIDENMVKLPVGINRPAKQASSGGQVSDTKQREQVANDWLSSTTKAIDTNDKEAIDSQIRTLLRGGGYDDVSIEVVGDKMIVKMFKPIQAEYDNQGNEVEGSAKRPGETRVIDLTKNVQDQLVGLYQKMTGSDVKFEKTKTDPRGAEGSLLRQMEQNAKGGEKKVEDKPKSWWQFWK